MCSSHFKWAFCIKCVAVKLFSVPVQKSNKVKEQLKDLTRGLLRVETQLRPQRRLIGSGKFGLRGPGAVRMQEHPWQRNSMNYDKTRISYKPLILHFYWEFKIMQQYHFDIKTYYVSLFTWMTHNQKWTFPTTTLNSPSELQCMSLPLLLEHKLTQATHGTRDLFCSC